MRRVVITGVGMVTPLGADVETVWANILASKSGAGVITRFDPTDPRMRVLDVLAALADPATDPALLPALRATLADVRSSVESLGAGVHLLRR